MLYYYICNDLFINLYLTEKYVLREQNLSKQLNKINKYCMLALTINVLSIALICKNMS